MVTRRLRWQGPTRTEACRQRLQQCLEAWRRDWCIGDEPVPVAAARTDALATAASWHGARHAGASVWLADDASDPGSLGATLVAQNVTDTAGLAGRLARRALDDLLARLLDAAPERLEALAEPGADDLATRHGAMAFSLSGPLSGRHLVLDAEACDTLMPPEPALLAPLALRRQAVLPETVTLGVSLPLGEQLLSESLAFRVGEVLLAGPLSGAQVQLVAVSGRVIASGALARAGEQRALRVEIRQDSKGNPS